MFLGAAWNRARWIVQHDQDAQASCPRSLHLRISAKLYFLQSMAACPARRKRTLVGETGFRRDFPRLNPITIYLMIDLGQSRRPGKIIAVEVLTLAVRAHLSR